MERLFKVLACALLFVTLISSNVFADTNTITFLQNEFYRTSDPLLKREMIKTLGNFDSDSNVASFLQNTLNDLNEYHVVRIQAAYELSNLTDDINIRNAIIRAHDRSSDISFRAAMLKSLYNCAQNDQRLWNVLINNLRANHDYRIQEASAFALQNGLNNQNIRLALMQTADSPFKAKETRVAAIKTLYHGLNNPEVRNKIENILRNANNPIEVRSAATRVLSLVTNSRQSRSALFDLVANSAYTELRTRAVAGLKFQMNEEDVAWLQLSIDPRSGLQRSPF